MNIKDCINGFVSFNKNIKSDNIIAIKEPYLLYIIEYIINYDITIVMIRNKQNTINSCEKFISISSKIKYIIVDYDK